MACSPLDNILSLVFCTAYLKHELVCLFSEDGSSRLPAEKQTYIYFVDFLDECDGKLCSNGRAGVNLPQPKMLFPPPLKIFEE